jgi:dipeptide/tripeptide permease
MNNLSVAITKTLLSSLSAIVILLSSFLMILIFNMWIQEGIPPFENVKFSIALFFITIMLLVICQCIKYYADMAMDSRMHKAQENINKERRRTDDLKI